MVMLQSCQNLVDDEVFKPFHSKNTLPPEDFFLLYCFIRYYESNILKDVLQNFEEFFK